jgi:hypothetical protein
MGLKETLLGWLRRTPEADAGLERAATDTATREYSEEKTDGLVDSRLGSGHDEFEADERGPR